MSIVLFSETPIYGGVKFLYQGIKKTYPDTKLCCFNHEPYNYGNKDDTILYCDKSTDKIKKLIKNCDLLIISATISLRYLCTRVFNDYNILKDKKVKIVIGDSHFCNNNVFFNYIFNEYKIDVYIMPDIAKYCFDIPYKRFYPPVKLMDNDIHYSTTPFIISHLPGIKFKINQKGTNEITKICNELVKKYDDVQYITKGRVDWKEVIKIKKNTTLYIDQLIKDNPNANMNRFKSNIPYYGGLGKSGIESMMLGIPTITSGDGDESNDVPIDFIDYNNIKERISYYIENRDILIEYGTRQKQWVKNNCSVEKVTEHVLEGYE